MAVLQEIKTYTTEKSDVHQGCLVPCAYLVDSLWFAVDQFRIPVFYFDIIDVIAFKGVVLWRVQLAGLSVVDIAVDCGMIHLFFTGYGRGRLAAMLTFGSCVTFVLPVDVSSLAKISADAVARWVTLAAVEKVGRVPCHTF